jgi:hypothetical protein
VNYSGNVMKIVMCSGNAMIAGIVGIGIMTEIVMILNKIGMRHAPIIVVIIRKFAKPNAENKKNGRSVKRGVNGNFRGNSVWNGIKEHANLQVICQIGGIGRLNAMNAVSHHESSLLARIFLKIDIIVAPHRINCL